MKKIESEIAQKILETDKIGYRSYSYWVGLRPNWNELEKLRERFEELNFRVSTRKDFIDFDWSHKYDF